MKKFIANLDVSLAVLFLVLIAMIVFAANATAAPVSANGADARINRYVVAVSANYGGEGRPMLRYAESDAKSFANVLKEMGGVQPQNMTLVKEPTVDILKQEFSKLDGKISENRAVGGRNEVLVFYSGHADEKGLRLGNETYAWKEFRSRIDALHADVKIAVIDACGSGAITRAKGGVAVPAFMVDESSDMKGYAFITSSTQDESSQESDRLKGSFFTHSLVSGLRGAGDISGDGRVTLSEAYQFAFNETLQKTEATMGGAQHPSRDMNLAGTGDVVMTDLHSTGALLDLASDVEGRLFIRNESGELVAELNKKNGHPMSLGLSAGKYAVRLETSASVKEAKVALAEGKHESLSQNHFQKVDVEMTMLRGEIGGNRVCSNQDSVKCSLDSLDHNGKTRTTFNAFDHETEPRKGVQIGVFIAKTDDYMLGTQVSLIANIAQKEMHGVQVSAMANMAFDHFEGVQASSTFNFAKSFEGAQVSGALNLAKSFNGAQVAGGFNISMDASAGAQIAPINVATDTVSAAQVGAINVGKYSAVQVGAINAIKEVKHQWGAINVATDSVTNIQVGAINYATNVTGRQIGAINVCLSCEKTPIGLINIVGNGLWTATGSFNEMGGTGVKLDMGTAYWYTSLEWARNFESGHVFSRYADVWEGGVGVGTHFGRYGDHFELEYMFLTSTKESRTRVGLGDFDDDPGFHHRLRFGATKKICTGLGVTGGVSLNIASKGEADEIVLRPMGGYHVKMGSGNHEARFWPGFYVGLVAGRF